MIIEIQSKCIIEGHYYLQIQHRGWRSRFSPSGVPSSYHRCQWSWSTYCSGKGETILCYTSSNSALRIISPFTPKFRDLMSGLSANVYPHMYLMLWITCIWCFERSKAKTTLIEAMHALYKHETFIVDLSEGKRVGCKWVYWNIILKVWFNDIKQDRWLNGLLSNGVWTVLKHSQWQSWIQWEQFSLLLLILINLDIWWMVKHFCSWR